MPDPTSMAAAILSRLPQPPDPTKAEGNGITGFFSGLLGGMGAGKAFMGAKASAGKQGNFLSGLSQQMGGPPLGKTELKEMGVKKPSFLQAIAQGVVNAPGERAAGADPMFDLKRKFSEQTAQMNAIQIDEVIRN